MKKRIAIICNDTRGGVQPYVALALGLRSRGHDVRAVAPSNLVSMFTSHGFEAAALSGDAEALLKETNAAARGTLAAMKLAAKELPNWLARWTREVLEACAGADLMTGGIGGMAVGLSVADKLGAPFVETHLQPVRAPTGLYPGVLFPNVPPWLGSLGRSLSHHATEMALWLPFKGAMMHARKNVLGLEGSPRANLGQPMIYGLSRHVVPMPPSPNRHVTGYWFLPEPSFAPEPALEAFVSRPGPIISIGFGSMSNADAAALTLTIERAVKTTSARAILLSGWGGLAHAQSEHIFTVESVPHSWLFPRVSAVVHHGGAGTTGAALASGRPSLVIPFAMDQPFWGARTHALGVGPPPIPRKNLTERRLVAALKVLLEDAAVAERAGALGSEIRAEHGVENACAIIGA